ncbi:unnamed protein product, partial [marine sediment metagenome]
MKHKIGGLYKPLLDDVIELTKLDRFREFIFVTHNYLDEALDSIIINYFVKKDKEKKFKNNLYFLLRSFDRKLDILKNCDLLPHEFYLILKDYNKIRNIVAHNVKWKSEMEKRKNPKIKHDRETLYKIVPTMFAILHRCLELS